MTATKTFTELGLDVALNDALTDKGITHPFPIQELTLPLALKGADLIGQARTGTGKTLAFGLPLLQRIDPTRAATQALVIVPTRELCLQVADDLEIGRAIGITSIAVYGGVAYEDQIEALRGGVHVVVGTPGRTLDHLQRGNLDLSGVRVVVLDEADEMLDMGFLPDVERLLSACPNERQTMLFSATMPTAIVKLARRFMNQPTFMRADAEPHETAPTVEQHFFLVHRMDKPRVLARILQAEDRGGAMVFTRTKSMADRLVRELEDLNVPAIAVHGDLRQATREKNMDRFRVGKANVLVATEVAARGIDVDNVTHVVNYDCPDDEKMYLHRIGRTARAGATGVAITFAEFNEVDRVNVIRKAVGTDVELREVFSTSDELAKTFGLPETTPWDHLVGSGKRPARSSSSDNASASSRSTANSDGRSRNRTSSRAANERPRTRQTAAAASSEEPSTTSTRTRTRTREPVRTSERTPDESKPAPATRTRARAQRSTSDASEAATSKAEASKPARSRSSKSNSTSGQSSSRKASSTSGSASKKSTARNDGRRRDSDERSSTRKAATRTTTHRGEQARGDGKPRFSRRLEVEHLP